MKIDILNAQENISLVILKFEKKNKWDLLLTVFYIIYDMIILSKLYNKIHVFVNIINSLSIIRSIKFNQIT